MQSVIAKEIPEVVQMWTDIFNLQKKYYNAPTVRDSIESEEYWKSLVAESSQIQSKYQDDVNLFLLCGKVINAIIEDIGKRASGTKQ